MNFRLQQHRLHQLASRLNLMIVLVFGLLLTNVLLGSLSWYALLHQKVEVTPFMGGSTYQKSDAFVDTHYLQMMSENFLYARLNVTPQTVLSNHSRLLSFVDSRFYADFKSQLHKEAELIQKQQITSHLDVLSIDPNPSNLTCVVQGLLKRRVGTRELSDEPITYTLKLNYHFGRLSIQSFTHQPGVVYA